MKKRCLGAVAGDSQGITFCLSICHYNNENVYIVTNLALTYNIIPLALPCGAPGWQAGGSNLTYVHVPLRAYCTYAVPVRGTHGTLYNYTGRP